ncbi:MAG: T9SS C-terminal target domain-containing protein [Bacteroidota bacterium]
MKNIIRYLLVAILLVGFSKSIYAEEWPVLKSHKNNGTNKSVAEGCLPASASTDLDVNNVRARINTGGDMWWDLQGNPEYFIPGNTTKTSMFSAALWIGGLDVNGQLKLAAQRYRGNGNDYWTGPITNDGTASTDASICEEYDKHYVITRAEVEGFKAAFLAGGFALPSGYEVPRCIQDYPAIDQAPNHSLYLAPFFDYDGDGLYDYKKGDYPYYDFANVLCPSNYPPGTPQPLTMEGNGILADQVLKGDMTLWWVFNDKGNIHTETKGEAVGMEIRAQAFGFSTNDDINNMTFYSYEIINRSTYRLTETYFSQWVDTDLGYAKDDYVGCDVLRGLGYCYNGVDPDGQGKPQDYGAQPPAVGVDFFQGPYMDPDGLDNPKYDINTPLVNCNEAINGLNFGNGIKDDERFGMRRFVFHNNTGGLDAITDPDIAPEYYNLLRGIWKDGERMVYGGLGHPSAGGTGPAADFMFPDDTDPCNWGTAGIQPSGFTTGAGGTGLTWTDANAGNPPDDRRFMQSAGPFTLEPGAVNYITVGIPWARATAGGPWASVELLRVVDDKCQALFDNCFKVLDGPDAPDLTIQELDKELILYLTNRKVISNNYRSTIEDYIEVDKSIIDGDSAYRFEGYQIFQVKDASVSVTDIHNADLARLVAQCDIKNGISKIINFNYSEALGGSVPTLEVDGANSGIVHSFRIFEDKFATGDNRLVNHKQYYYIAIAYAYNNFKTYDQTNPLNIDGQKLPYKAGRKAATGGITVVSAMPHIPSPEAGGTILNSEYGVMPQIKRLEGNGNGGLILDFTAETNAQLISGSPYFAPNPTYDFNKGPLNIKVIDPLNVAPGNFTLKLIPPASGLIDSSNWILTNITTGMSWNSEKTINVANEQLLLDIGLSVTISQTKYPGDLTGIDNGVLESTIQFADSSKKWLTGVMDIDSYFPFNWIRSGNTADPNDVTLNDYNVFYSSGSMAGTAFDPNENYEKILTGTWAPYRMASKFENGPQWDNTVANVWNKLGNLYSIDLYLTPDRSKWTRCPVIEECEDANTTLTEGNVKKFDMRAGQTDGEVGMGWFPGYAINVETGERLNMMFGEDSWLQGENGRDMIWNPTNNYVSTLGQVLFGGKHWTYIMGHNGDTYNTTYSMTTDCPAYDGGAWIKSMLYPSSNPNHTAFKRFVYKDVMWVGCPIISDVKYNFTDPSNMPCEVKIRIRMSRPYQRYYSTAANGATLPENNNYPMYSFSTDNIAAVKGNATAAEGSLNLINAVPNPYFAYSGYETNQLDNRVRITNLPQKCTITIYTVGGSLVRQYAKDDGNSFVDWDLKNFAGIPIAGGMYLIYVKVDGVGEKVVKWFGSLRPIDLNAF